MVVKIHITGKIPKNPVVIEAFPSKGYVSTVAANHLIKQLGFEQVGYFESDRLDAVAVVHDGTPMHPIRVYSKDNMVIIFSELIIPFNLVHDFTREIGGWLEKIKPEGCFLLASIPGSASGVNHEITCVSTDKDMIERIEKLGVKKMMEGVLTGMSSSLLVKCCNMGIPATALTVETNYIPDVLAAAKLLDTMCEILGIEVNVNDLVNTGENIEKKFKNNLTQMKKGRDDYEQMHDMSMYR
jgi:uncharacterized protein